jgi:curli biogenesis system outer membrane secretion channel CsgG
MRKLLAVVGAAIAGLFVSLQSAAATDYSLVVVSWAGAQTTSYAVPAPAIAVGKFNTKDNCLSAAKDVKAPAEYQGLVICAVCVRVSD